MTLTVNAQDYDKVGDDGPHKQAWFFGSFLEFAENLSDAAAEGKDLLMLTEQAGCPCCRALHAVNFERSKITELPEQGITRDGW